MSKSYQAMWSFRHWTFLAYIRPMVTRDELAELLLTVNVRDVAKAAKLSTKTIYRLRHRQNSPTLDTVASLVEAVKRVRAAQRAA